MRYQPDHKERTRKQIIATAANLFRRDGVVATGVVTLMKGVGLTQGGFYAHFASKEALIREAATAAVLETSTALEKIVTDAGKSTSGLKVLINAYLSETHLKHVERGCAIAAVGAELAREPTETREAVMLAADRIVSLIANHLPEDTLDPRGVAQSVFGLLSGTLQLARLTANPARASEILASGRYSALVLCGVPTSFPQPQRPPH